MTPTDPPNADPRAEPFFCGTCGEIGHYAGDGKHFCGRPKNPHPSFDYGTQLNPQADTMYEAIPDGSINGKPFYSDGSVDDR